MTHVTLGVACSIGYHVRDWLVSVDERQADGVGDPRVQKDT